MNSVNLIGNIGNSPELKTTPSGKTVCSFRIAVKDAYSSDKTFWFNVVCWGKTAELASIYTKKGSKIGISGRLTSRDYTDKEGNKRIAFEIVADRLFFVGDKREGETGNQTSYQPNAALAPNVAAVGDFQVVDDDSSDLPF